MFEIINDHIKNISTILTLTKTDLIRNYYGSLMGWLWAILKPAFKIFIYYFMLAIGLKISKDMFGYPYFLWLISGMIPWFYINDMLSQGSASIRKYSYLVTKMKFPLSAIPTFTSMSRFIVHIFLILITIFIFFLSGYNLDIYASTAYIHVFAFYIFHYIKPSSITFVIC